jgi:copper(I)-binding protein
MRPAFLAMAFTAASIFAAPALAQSAKIEVGDPWARTPIGQARNTAAYMTLMNRGSEPDRLLSVSTVVAGKAELHATVREGDVMRMREVQSIELKPGAAVSLAPGGLHIMLLDVQRLTTGAGRRGRRALRSRARRTRSAPFALGLCPGSSPASMRNRPALLFRESRRA